MFASKTFSVCVLALTVAVASTQEVGSDAEGNLVLDGDSVKVTLGAEGSVHVIDSASGDVKAKLPQDIEDLRRATDDTQTAIADGFQSLIRADDTRQSNSDDAQNDILTAIYNNTMEANKYLSRIADSMEQMAQKSTLQWVGASKKSLTSGENATLYGRGFIARAVGLYSVDVMLGNEKHSQDIVEVTDTTVTFTTKAMNPPSKTGTADIMLKEDTKEIKFQEDQTSMSVSWTNAVPTIMLEDPMPVQITAIEYHAANFEYPINVHVMDADHAMADLTVKATSSDTSVIKNANINVGAPNSEGVAVVKITQIENKIGTVDVTIMVEDKLNQVSSSVVKRINVFGGIAIDGWELVMKIRGCDGNTAQNSGDAIDKCDYFTYDHPGWEDDKTYGDATTKSLAPANVKFDAFNRLSFTKMRICSGNGNGKFDPKTGGPICYTHEFRTPVTSARDIFHGCDITPRNAYYEGNDCRIQSTEIKDGLVSTFQSTNHRDCPPQIPGISQHQNDHVKTRFGFGANINTQSCQPSDNQDTDACIGVGLSADAKQQACVCGAGMTSWFQSYPADDCRDCQDAWIWIQ